MGVKLKNAPIIEAVVDIDCDFTTPLDLKSKEMQARKALARLYPKMKPVVVQDHRFEGNEYSMKTRLAALQFLKTDEKQLVQFRTEGFSFNRLAPYTSLDDYLPQIKRAFETYIKTAGPVKVKSIRLRYINRILLPSQSGRADLGKYIRNSPQTADSERLELRGFLNQYLAIDKETGNQVHSILTVEQPADDKLPVIFDNGVAAIVSENPKNWEEIKGKIIDLRELKNHIFESTLTKKCLTLF